MKLKVEEERNKREFILRQEELDMTKSDYSHQLALTKDSSSIFNKKKNEINYLEQKIKKET